MLNHEAINKLFGIDEKMSSNSDHVALSNAIRALERLEPKKPEKLLSGELFESGWKYKCPICERAVGVNVYVYTEESNFCSNCGQALMWEK